ncbi:fungal-specific transcription factor domain-containing protein [Mytilinidion resinicola]|uniref:Fungal-specific transcription factor domain-containing protein n=1 Tax=Mytilinidion resinicola TaxID=574789 RepID=A0A6A6YYW6_9PEZI|nr:fungal-specific transcription factor domain-containing protein [Mytilinidion resinicola]KAF2813633.1 fungal-specific transcription factor domain-containing protein [Mytilinidion resinicola]
MSLRAVRADDSSDPTVGDLFKSRDAPSFFGSSYFGPQAAAKIMEAPAPDLTSGIRSQMASSTHSFRDEGGPFSQIWDLLGLLPRKKSTVDRITDCFLNELNWTIDAVCPASFRSKYDDFWERKFGFDDFATIDLRWLALLFIVLAFGVLLDCPRPKNKEVQRELQDTSLRFYWAARRAIVIAPTFYGESTDLVRAGVLVTRYLIYSRRVPESWLTTSFAMRMAQAQGMHIDGERWRLPRKETETRRRLWSHLYMLDKTIALALGRPFAILDQQCLVKKASNVWLDDMTDEEAASTSEAPLSEPTLSVCTSLAHHLAIIVGKIQEHCFGLFTDSYDMVLSLNEEIVTWEAKLPPYFKLHDPDTSKDGLLPFLFWNRLHLHSMYHFARVTLHRPYLLRQSITNRFRHSHDICIASACADLDMRLKYLSQRLNDRLKWCLGPHHLFNSALVLGIIAVREPHSRRSIAILEDLEAYCEMQKNDIWINEFALAEVKIVELCIKRARKLRTSAQSSSAVAVSQPSTVPAHATDTTEGFSSASTETIAPAAPTNAPAPPQPHFDYCGSEPPLMPSFPPGDNAQPWQTAWADPSFSLLEAADLQHWEYVLDNITQYQMSFMGQ